MWAAPIAMNLRVKETFVYILRGGMAFFHSQG